MGLKKKTDSAKKRANVERNKRYRSRQIIIGDQVERWNEVKKILNAQSDSDVAKVLIDRYLESRSSGVVAPVPFETPKAKQMSSTPAQQSKILITEPGISSVTEDSDGSASKTDSELPGPSGVKRKLPTDFIKPAGTSKSRVEIEMSSTDLEDIYDPDYDPDDPTFQPFDFNISIMQSCDDDNDDIEEHGLEDSVFQIPQEEEPERPVIEGPGIPVLTEVNTEMVKEQKFMVTRERLDVILDLFPEKLCHRCGKRLVRNMNKVCEDNHVHYRWSTSAMLPDGMYQSNLQAAAAVVLSGNNYAKVALFAKFLGLSFPGPKTFHAVQGKCVVPVVDEYWENMKLGLLEEHRATTVVISGDGRMDSPGHCAKYCTYTMMNQEDKAILAMEVVDKRETALKSGLMEARGFRKAVDSIKQENITIQEIVTDAHPQIASIMKKNYPEVRHSYDMWHGAKNLGKKIHKIANVKGNEILKPWVKDITNHFFHCAETCEGNVLDMKTKWISIINHLTNRHSWALGACDHGPIEEDRGEKQWLRPSSKLAKDIEKEVTEKRLLRTFPYYTTCQTTSELESFNNHLLMYAPKRNAFSYQVYKCRCQLAAIDYTQHLKRKTLLDENGKQRCKRTYSKAANNWSVIPVKEDKTYEYIPDMMTKIMNRYCRKDEPLRTKATIPLTDPRRISKTIYPTSPPKTAELRERQVARIKKFKKK